jgi:branched-subunit amino acid transport protein
MAETTLIFTILGMLVVTYLPRLLLAWFLRGRELPGFLAAWLKYIPAAVLAALLLPSLLVEGGKLNLAWNNLYLWAALPAFLVAWRTRNMFATLFTGMAVVALVRLIF